MENTELPVLTETDVHTAIELRTSYNNMLCHVTYEAIPEQEQAEIEELLAVAN